MEIKGLKKVAARASRAACIAVVFAFLSACGGGGGGQSAGPETYTGTATKASLNTTNAVAYTSDAFAAASIGSSSNVVGVMAVAAKVTGSPTVTLPELFTQLQGGVTKGLSVARAKSATLAGVAASSTINGAVGGTASIVLDVQPSGNFTGRMTLDHYQEMTGGPVMSGTVTVSGVFNETTQRYDSITLTCWPLTATTSAGTTNLFGSFAFSATDGSDVLRLSCTVNVAGKTYWIKDWTYTFTPDNHLTITGVYYHPAYGYAEMTTPTPLVVTSLDGYPSSGVFQAAGAHCSKARLTFSATGTLVTAIGGDDDSWTICTE